MKFNAAQAAATGRHIATFVAGLATMFGVLHVVSVEQANQFAGGIGKIADGVGDILVVIGPILAGISAYFSQRSASPPKQADSLIASGEAHKIEGTPELAEETKSPKVVASIPVPIASSAGPR
jgi:hypothetical protein